MHLRMARRRTEPNRTSVSSRAASKSAPVRPVQPVLPASPVPPQPPPLPPPQQPPTSVDFGLLQRPSPRTTISDVRDNTDTRKMGATTSSFTDAGREVTADGLELTGAERATLDPQQLMKKQCSDWI
mmetsp:Transcript_24619/g.55725  ORF Transcript_24619/g.55725 Transcript_24619/m.55725 type:complete len:127 (+) Transcript_24619:172-552(+)